MAISISDKPVKLRIAGPRGIKAENIDREKNIIRDFSVITKGEALGHGLWIDDEFLDQLAKAGAGRKEGLKSRLSHPGLSGDGMGKQVGRAKNYRREGDQVLADLHLYRKSNQENVATILDLAEEDPAAFGASIVFELDLGAMKEFEGKHSDKDGQFRSPDKANKKSYRHARLAEFYAVDMVDDPAANPDGLFSFPEGSELAARAEHILQFAFGLTEQEPDALTYGPHPERARAFMAEFLKRHGLKVIADESGEKQDFGMFKGQLEETTKTILEIGSQIRALTSWKKTAQAQLEILKRRNRK